MAPFLTDGSLVLARKCSSRTVIVPGDVAVIDHAAYGRIIKRIVRIEGDAFFLAGDGIESTPAVDMGAVPRKRIIAIHIQFLRMKLPRFLRC